MNRLGRGAFGALCAVIVLAVPVAVIGTAVVTTFQPWIVDVLYSTPGFPDAGPGPDDNATLSDATRDDLAKDGVRAVAPLGDGADSLRQSTFEGGGSAFTPDEVEHMADVEGVVHAIAAAWLFALACIAAALISLRSAGAWRNGLAAVGIGAILTLALSVALGAWMLIDFESAFSAFHEATFDPGTWTFAESATLRRLYPDAFWNGAAAIISVLVIGQAAALAFATAGPTERALRSGSRR